MRLKDFAKIYFSILLLHLVTIYKQDPGLLHGLSKGLLLLGLLGFYAQHANARFHAFKILLLFALGFSWLGDLLLLSDSSTFFLMGLVAFAVAHLFYVAVHLQLKVAGWQLKKVLLLSLAVLVTWALVAWYLPLPPAIGIYALGYAMVLLVHLALAFYNFWTNALNIWPFVGMAFFLVSDLLLALNDFVHYSLYTSLGVMLFYGIGQFLMVMGFLKKSSSSALEPTESKS